METEEQQRRAVFCRTLFYREQCSVEQDETAGKGCMDQNKTMYWSSYKLRKCRHF